MNTDDVVFKIDPPSYMRLPDNWEYFSGVIKRTYEDNHLLSICFIDKTLSVKNYDARPIYYEQSFNIDWLWPDDVKRIEWLSDVLSSSLLENIKKGQSDIKSRLRNSISYIRSLLE